jgi:hypothetical protein
MGLPPRVYLADWAIPLCRGVGGIEHEMFEGLRLEVSWLAPGVASRGAIPRTAPDPKLCLNVASINHRTIKKWIGPKEP